MIKAVIFDMDGVISDTEHLHVQAGNQSLKAFNITISKEEADSYSGMPDRSLFRLIAEKHGLNTNIDEIIKKKDNILIELIVKHLKAVDGSIELIKRVKDNKLKLAVASSTRDETIDLILRKLDVKSFFDVIFSGNRLDKPKPYPDVFLLTAKKLDIKPEECLVIEDTKNGVQAAKSAGMKCIGLRNKNSGNQDLSAADLIVDDLNKITIDLIKRM
jgi:beta-phosphoglucomutase family hydrolase